jgi:hypothetical protein
VVQEHPLADFSKIRDYQMPELHLDLEKTKADIARQKAQGLFTRGGLAHGHTFLRLTDLCGYENVLLAPYNAVFHNDADNYYYIYRLVDGQAQKRQVRILYRTGNRNQVTEDTRYWILWGVDEGDTLVSG